MRVFLPVACLLALVLGGSAGALEIVIDPGPVGSEPPALFFDVPELVGVELAGQDLTLDFVLASHKHLEVDFGTVTNDLAWIQLNVTHDAGAALGQPTADQFFLGDENGVPVVEHTLLPAFAVDFFRVQSQIPRDKVDGAIFHTIHFAFALNDAPGAFITDAQLVLEFDFEGVYRVGEWTDMPGPGVLGLLGLAVPFLALRLGKGRRP